MVIKKSEIRKRYKGVTINQNMKKGGVFCFSGISLNQLGLNMNNPLMKCCNSTRVTHFSNSPNHLEMVKGV
jgi:hypothetical protein